MMNNISKTDWEALAAITDEEIDYSEIAPLSATFFERARVWRPQPQVTLKLQVGDHLCGNRKSEVIQ